MLNFWSTKLPERDFLKMCWIDFGCPGHGKGPWDGLGAVLKQQVTRDITNGKILTKSGYISCPEEVAEHLSARFATDEWKEKHKDKHINEIIISFSPHNEIARPRVDHKFDSLDGSKSSYSYMMLAKDQIARRGRSCYCEGCFRARGRTNMTSAGDKLICEACTHRDKPVWTQQTVRDQGVGAAARRKAAQDEGIKFAKQLLDADGKSTGNGFLAIQARAPLVAVAPSEPLPLSLPGRRVSGGQGRRKFTTGRATIGWPRRQTCARSRRLRHAARLMASCSILATTSCASAATLIALRATRAASPLRSGHHPTAGTASSSTRPSCVASTLR